MDIAGRKTLIVAAHKLEASVFLQKLAAKRSPWQLPFELFHAASGYKDILICGEGRQAAAIATASTLASSQGQYDRVVNIGVCLALDKGLSVFDVIKVRTCYAQRHEQDMEFSSYTSTEQDARVDLVTVNDRISDEHQAGYLANFATIADREAWSIAQLCQLYKIKFYAFKCISDVIGSPISCEDVRAQATQFSEQLFTASEKLLSGQSSGKPENREQPLDTRDLEGCHLTTSQRHRLKKLTHSLNLKYANNKEELDTLIRKFLATLLATSKLTPKQRSNKLLSYYEELLSPETAAARKNLDDLLAPLNRNGLTTKFDKTLESSTIKVEAIIHNNEDIAKIISQLSKLDINRVTSLLDAGRHDAL